MKKLILIIFLNCGISNILFSWDTEAAKYFPLSIGNSWTYNHVDYAFGCTPVNIYNRKTTIIGDSIIGNHRYFKFSNGDLYRIDSNSMNVYRRIVNTDCLTDSLAARFGDSFNTCSSLLYLADTNAFFFAGQQRATRGEMIPDYVRRLMYGIGLYSDGSCIHPVGGTEEILRGCVIRGVVYGDTTVSPVDTSILDYLPLKIGNVWVYKWYLEIWMPPVYDSGYFVVRTTNIVNRNNKNYFDFSTSSVGCTGGFGNIFTDNLIRIDSVSGNVVKFDSVNGCPYSPSEIMLDSLKMRLYDSVNYTCQTSYFRPYCNDTTWQNIFGLSRPSKSVYFPNLEQWSNKTFIKGIGISRFSYEGASGPNNYYGCFHVLKGCVIDGVVYGDTSFAEFHSVTGTVRYQDNNQNVSSGYVKAYRHSYLGYMDVLDSAVIQPNGTYTLTKIPLRDTTDLMAFQNDEINSHDFVPTYYRSTIYWQEADHLFLNNDTSGIDISVFRITNDRFGIREISGGVYGYYNADAWKGISDARLYAVSQSTFRSYDISVETGLYAINSLPSGQYQIICNRIGFETQTQDVYLGNTNRTDINFYFDHLVSAPENNAFPEQFTLFQNYPNPFNPVTHLRFNIGKIGYTSLIIYDVQGQELARLVNEELKPGQYDIKWDASNYPSGVYFYKLRSGTFTKSMKMVLIK